MIINMVTAVQEIGYHMGKRGVAWHVDTTNMVTLARKNVIRSVARYNESQTGAYPKTVRVLLLDDDNPFLTGSEELARIMLEADRKGLNIVANYKSAYGANLVFKEADKVRYTDTELRQLADSGPEFVPLTGVIGSLGFYYGDVPTDYVWHMDETNDEATMFFRENPQLKVHLATRIKLAHRISWYRSTFVDYEYKEGTPEGVAEVRKLP